MTPPDIVSWNRDGVLPVVIDAIRLLTRTIDRTSGDPEWTIGHGGATTVRGPSDPKRHHHASGIVVETNRSEADTHVQFGIVESSRPSRPVLTLSVPIGRMTPTDPGTFMPHALRLLSAIPQDAADATDRIAHIGRGVVALTSTSEIEVRHVAFADHLPRNTDAPRTGLSLQDASFRSIAHPLVEPLSRVLPSMMVVRKGTTLLRIERATFFSRDRAEHPMASLRASAELRALLGDAS